MCDILEKKVDLNCTLVNGSLWKWQMVSSTHSLCDRFTGASLPVYGGILAQCMLTCGSSLLWDILFEYSRTCINCLLWVVSLLISLFGDEKIRKPSLVIFLRFCFLLHWVSKVLSSFPGWGMSVGRHPCSLDIKGCLVLLTANFT